MKVWSKLLSFLKPQKISNKDVDLSDDNIFNRELKSIRKLKIEPFYAETGLIHTGSAKQIAEKRLCDTFCDGKTCDCCGRKLSPLAFETLCPECIRRMEKDSLYEGIFNTNNEKQAKLNKVWFVEQKI